MLAGEGVIEAVAEAFESSGGSMTERMLSAIQAGEEARGDKRAETAQSAALKAYHPTNPRLHRDLRVDDHEDPVPELQRTYEVAKADDDQWQEEFPEASLQRNP